MTYEEGLQAGKLFAELEAKPRELSDEEILEMWFYEPQKAELHEIKFVLNFARAILKKASEK